MIAFIGAKGGVGVTTLCVELAKQLRAKANVTVIDADFTARRSLAILLDANRALDAERAERHGPVSVRTQGITVGELSTTYADAFTLSPDEVEAFVQELDRKGTIIVDMPSPFSAAVRSFVVRTSRFLVVTEPTILGLAAARSMLSELQTFGLPASRLGVIVVARGDKNNVLNYVPPQRALEAKVYAEIPPASDRGYQRAIRSLEAMLANIEPEPTLSNLQPSARGAIRDRRLRPRDENVRLVALPKEKTLEVPFGTEKETASDERIQIKTKIHEALAQRVDLYDASKAQEDASKMNELRSTIDAIAQDVLEEQHFQGSAEELAQLKMEVVSEALGYGPLEEFMSDPEVTEIMANGPDSIYVERAGIIYPTERRFVDEKQLRLVIERIIAPLGRRVDESSPMVDARLPDGSRVNAIIEPLSIDGPALTIRRFGTRRITADDMLRTHTLNQPMLDFLRACAKARLNVVISGGTGSGKTTFLNVMSGFIPERERIITIEDAAELLLNQPHVVRLESRPANIEGRGEIRIRDLVRNALRMRPDRIIVGEARGGEALDMLQAMNTGHDGSLTTIHANSARDALTRIETMVLMAGFDLPVRAIREQIASALNVVIHTARLRDGTRRVMSISEIVGMEGDVVTMQDVVRFVQHGVDERDRVMGRFEYTGVQPYAMKRFAEAGVTFDIQELNELAVGGGVPW